MATAEMDSLTRNQVTMAQIKQLEDAPLNPLTGKEWPRGHDDILQGRRKLPVYQRLEEILSAYHQNQVFILASETGAGKSTQVPQLLMYDEHASDLRIACTQPRRLAATTLAKRVSKEMGVALGEEVGYQIGGKRRLDENYKQTRLNFMTEGVLLNKMAGDNNLSEYACIIIDEAHERTVEADVLMAMLKKVLRHRSDLKAIIMSATIDAKLFQEYFDCPQVHVPGRNFEVDILHLQSGQATPDFTVLAANTVAHIHKNLGPGHILVFLPGQSDINKVCELVRDCAQDLDVFPLYSKLATREQNLALGSSGPNRKCIVSTNVAETSLTIDNVVYVIDTGLSRQMTYNPRLDMDVLQVLPISQASATQRAGRAGRTRDGVCYRLYTKHDYDNHMVPSTEPAIRCSSVHAAVLRLFAAGYHKIIDFAYIDAPHPESLARAAQDLQDWGFISDENQITQSGRLASQCPVDPIWYHALELGVRFRCILDILDIAVLCNSKKPVFARSLEFEQVADICKESSAYYPSDHLAVANAFNSYMHARKKDQKGDHEFDLNAWCDERFLDAGALAEVYNARKVLSQFLQYTAKLRPSRAPMAEPERVRKTLAIAFCTQAAFYHAEADAYRTVHENVTARLSPLSSLLGRKYEWIVFTNLNMTVRQPCLEIATPIAAEWLVDLPYFQESRLPLKGNDKLRQPKIKESLDAAKARIEASQVN